MITALTAIGALVFTAQSLNATRDQVAVAEEGQFTDRYSRTIEQLGHQGADGLQVRLGAIYALERLASDSPRDQPTITEVLAAFIRTSVPTVEVDPIPTTDPGASRFACPADSPVHLRADVQAALTVLGRRNVVHDGPIPIDLSFSCLFGAMLDEAQLSQADLDYADLSGATMYRANLREANLYGAVVAEVFCDSADLSGRNLKFFGG